MKNVSELRNELSGVFQSLKNGDMEHKVASQLANLAGKMISSAKAPLDYHNAQKKTPKIPFLDK
jgi:hypothetical protein